MPKSLISRLVEAGLLRQSSMLLLNDSGDDDIC